MAPPRPWERPADGLHPPRRADRAHRRAGALGPAGSVPAGPRLGGPPLGGGHPVRAACRRGERQPEAAHGPAVRADGGGRPRGARAGCEPALPGDHRGRCDRGPAGHDPVPEVAADARRGALAGRLRDRLVLAHADAVAAAGRGEDRQELRRPGRHAPERGGARPAGHRGRAQPGHERLRGGGRAPGAGRPAHRDGVRLGAGLLPRAAGAGGRPRPARPRSRRPGRAERPPRHAGAPGDDQHRRPPVDLRERRVGAAAGPAAGRDGGPLLGRVPAPRGPGRRRRDPAGRDVGRGPAAAARARPLGLGRGDRTRRGRPDDRPPARGAHHDHRRHRPGRGRASTGRPREAAGRDRRLLAGGGRGDRR